MNEQSNVLLSEDKQLREIKAVIIDFIDIYAKKYNAKEVQKIFYEWIDQFFPKSKTTLTTQQILCVYDYFQSLALGPICIFNFDSFCTVSHRTVILTKPKQSMQKPILSLKLYKSISQFLPPGVAQYESIYRHVASANNRRVRNYEKEISFQCKRKKVCMDHYDPPNRMKWPKYIYNYRVYRQLPGDLQKILNTVESQIFIKCINFEWKKALVLFKTQFDSNPQFRRQYLVMLPIFQTLSYIEDETKANHGLQSMWQGRQKYEIMEQSENPIGQQTGQEKILHNKISQINSRFMFLNTLSLNFYGLIKNSYLSAVLYFLSICGDSSAHDFEFIIQNQKISYVIRFFFARRFLNNKHYTSYLDKIDQQIQDNSRIQHILFTRDETQMQKIIRSYLDQTYDIEKAAIVSLIIVIKQKSGSKRKFVILEEILQKYIWMIKASGESEARVKLTQSFLQIQDPREIDKNLDIFKRVLFYFGCSNCGQCHIFSHDLKDFVFRSEDKGSYQEPMQKNFYLQGQANQAFEVHSYSCNICHYMNACCAVCLQPIPLYNPVPYVNQVVKGNSSEKKNKSNFNYLYEIFQESLVWCPKCNHGGHFKHIQQWHKDNPKTCPNFGCACQCEF